MSREVLLTAAVVVSCIMPALAREEPGERPAVRSLMTAVEAELPAVRWAIIGSLLTSGQTGASPKDNIYAFSFIKKELANSSATLPEDSPAALAAACGWFTGLYNRQVPFIYISREPDNDIMLSAFIAQYYLLLLHKTEKIEPERVADFMPLAITVSLMSWLDLSAVEAGRIYPSFRAWAAELRKARLMPGVALLLRLGNGPSFPGDVPEAELERLKAASLPVEREIMPWLSPTHRAMYAAQEAYAFPAGLGWLEPLGMVIESVYELGFDDKAIAATKAKIEIIRELLLKGAP